MLYDLVVQRYFDIKCKIIKLNFITIIIVFYTLLIFYDNHKWIQKFNNFEWLDDVEEI